MNNIVFETERLVFKKFNLSNFDNFCKINQDREIMKYFLGYEKSYRECLEKYEEMTISDERYHFTYWAVYIKDKDKFIGQCGFLYNYDGSINLCYAYNKKEWGKGYATEAGNGAIKYMFDNFENVKELTAMSYTDNKKSMNVLTKLGFKFLKESFNKQGTVFHYILTKEDYKNRTHQEL